MHLMILCAFMMDYCHHKKAQRSGKFYHFFYFKYLNQELDSVIKRKIVFVILSRNKKGKAVSIFN